MSRIAVLALSVAGALVLGSPAQAGSDIMTLGLDMQVSGNSPRSVADIDQCFSAEIGQPVTVDVVLPEPGVPQSRGVSAYQYTLFYDGKLLSVTGDEPEMLLDQAPGSALIPLAQGKPDNDGIYTSAAVDFGPKGIEPEGASETGPGVLARLTLTPHSPGISGLVIRDVSIKDDAGDDIEVISILSAHLYAGEPCPGQATPAATAAPASTPRPAQAESRPSGTDVGGPAPSPGALAGTGGRPDAPAGPAALLLGLGCLMLAAGGAAIGAAWAGGRRL